MFYIKMFGISLLLTLVIETVTALLLRIKGRNLLMVFLVNLLTNPAVVYVSWAFDLGIPGQLAAEICAVIAEGFVYKVADKWGDFSFRRPFLYSLIMNTVSYGLGLVIGLLGRLI
ncbi:MAG: hypothetical protein IJ796_08410 [Lachnospiraceae bacterium]|nr:hypothetical protein [Lachnospiraceae bacterium]